MTDKTTQDKLIFDLINDFYKVATADFMIGYHFRKIQTHSGTNPLAPPIEAFAQHIPRIVDFWKMLLLGQKPAADSGAFNLIETHRVLKVRRGEVGRWVQLFRTVIDQYIEDWPQQQEFLEAWWLQIKAFEKRFLQSKVLFNYTNCKN